MLPDPDDPFKDIVPARTDGKKNKLPRGNRPLKNVKTFGQTVRALRKKLKNTAAGPDFDHQLEKRGLLKNGKLRGKAAR